MDKYICVKDLEEAALDILPKNVSVFYSSGATDEFTLTENRLSFQRYRIRPKCLVGVSRFDLSTTILGHKVSMPVGISPTALQRMAHPDGELATARAAEKFSTVYILSTIATSSIEEVAETAPYGNKWLQLYIYNDRDVTKKLLLRAEKAGFRAIVVTVDQAMIGRRRADIRNKFILPSHLRLANFEENSFSEIQSADKNIKMIEYAKSLFDKSVTWDAVKWLKSLTKLPIVAKGILRGDDAVKAVEAGCSGILVSNHGGRHLDGVPSTVEALPEIVESVKDYDIEVYMDGGVTSGTDVYKALALGARMVFIGKPALWGLAVGGQAGVQKMLQIIGTELGNTLQLAGTPNVADITRDMVRHESAYSKL